MPFILESAVSNLSLLVGDLLSQPEFCKALESIMAPKEDLPIIKGKVLYWNLTSAQGYVAIDTVASKAYRVFRLDDKLSNDYLCDPGLAIAVGYDILNFVEAANSQIELDSLLVDEGPDNNANGWVH